MAETSFDIVIIGSAAGRLCHGDTRRPARLQDGDCRARAPGRHLPQLGVHSDESAAALRRNLRLPAPCRRLRTVGERVRFDPAAVVKRSRAVAGRLNMGVGGLLKKNKVTVIWGEAKIAKPGQVIVAKPRSLRCSRKSAAPRRARRRDLRGQAHHHRNRRPPASASGP